MWPYNWKNLFKESRKYRVGRGAGRLHHRSTNNHQLLEGDQRDLIKVVTRPLTGEHKGCNIRREGDLSSNVHIFSRKKCKNGVYNSLENGREDETFVKRTASRVLYKTY